ncbi:MAG: MotA/TolQ/ExbB proton channel family protein [Bacteroidia bacterium]|nr:MotA/TolQ/ExbB proton channel family protein [Bacteroidia bacterium]
MYNILLQIVSDSTATAAAVNAAPESALSLIAKGGIVMIPIGILLICAIYLSIERYITINKAAKLDPAFMSNIKDMVLNDNIVGAKKLCERTNTPMSRMIDKGISRIGKPIQDIESAIDNVGKLEIYKIEKNVGFLSTIAGLAPMFGFLGTVFGIIQIFQKISAEGLQISTVSGGLYVKMISSAAGLVLGIFAYASYHYLMLKIDRVANKMEANNQEFIDILQQPA